MNRYRAIKIHNEKRDYHRHIAETVLGRKLNKDEAVHHKDGNKFNNELRNLEIMTLSKHARMHGRESLNGAKLSKDNIHAIRALFSTELNNREIGRRFGVAKETIRDVRSGRTWAWL